MSTLRVTNVQDTSGGNSLTTAQIYNGAAKAWVNFNGTGTVAIRATFNVSSITDNGTGDYTVNFTTAMVDANYTPVVSVQGNGNNMGTPNVFGSLNLADGRITPTTSGFRFAIYTVAASNVDSTDLLVAVFR
jgi:hypothetical protein